MHLKTVSAAASLLALATAARASVIADFDDLPDAPAVNDTAGLFYANNGSDRYRDVVWDSRFSVVGDEYRVSPPDGPLFGLPKSAHYFVTNATDDVGSGFTNDGLLLTTTLILTEAWFGQNEYYGYGGGSDQVSIHALHGADSIGSVTLDLPEDDDGQPEPLTRIDTSAFLSLTGITGYRIDRRELGSDSGNWVADNFVFAQAPAPTPAWLLFAGLAPVLIRRRT